MKSTKLLSVAELFAGVGGFRLGLKKVSAADAFAVVWSNQWEPATKKQHASRVYEKEWGSSNHSNENIFDVLDNPEKFKTLQKANPDVLVGGFPCQDYSVAKPLNKSAGIIGEKGVLWWAIYRILEKRIQDGKPIKYLILENVDRLIKSPASARGRDFAVMLSSLLKLGYAVEWRVVNAADYGFPQRRKRIFIVGYYKSTNLYKRLADCDEKNSVDIWQFEDGILALALPVNRRSSLLPLHVSEISLDPFQVSQKYKPDSIGRSNFRNSGVAIDGRYWTYETSPLEISDYTDFIGRKQPLTLGDIVRKTKNVPKEYLVSEAAIKDWKYLKGAKSVSRIKKNGIEYTYDEGSMTFPDDLSKPARTIITAEGGTSPSRFKHIIKIDGGYRRLTPEELEDLNGFQRGFTDHPEVSETRRAFFMGNALVVGLVTRIAKILHEQIHTASIQ
jgi:DNA (cytosine-5)-methyltransferase 1